MLKKLHVYVFIFALKGHFYETNEESVRFSVDLANTMSGVRS